MDKVKYLKTVYELYANYLRDNPVKEKSLMAVAIGCGGVGFLLGWSWLMFFGLVIGLPNVIAYVQRKLNEYK